MTPLSRITWFPGRSYIWPDVMTGEQRNLHGQLQRSLPWSKEVIMGLL